MTDQKIYRIAGISALALHRNFFIEFPFYFVRSPSRAWQHRTSSPISPPATPPTS